MTTTVKKKASFTASQQKVIDRMKEGWGLGVTRMLSSHDGKKHCRLQQGGIGRGGVTEKVSIGTVTALYERGVLKSGLTDQTTMHYELDLAHPDLQG